MAEKRNPSLGEINEAIAREHGIDPAAIKDYKLPEGVSPTIDESRAANRCAPFSVVARVPEMVLPLSEGDRLEQEVEREELLGGVYAGMTREEAKAAEARGEGWDRRPKVVPLASKHTSNTAWSPLQMLEQLASDIRAGIIAPDAALVVYTLPSAAGGKHIHSARAQMEWTEEYAYLGVMQEQCIRYARGG